MQPQNYSFRLLESLSQEGLYYIIFVVYFVPLLPSNIINYVFAILMGLGQCIPGYVCSTCSNP